MSLAPSRLQGSESTSSKSDVRGGELVERVTDAEGRVDFEVPAGIAFTAAVAPASLRREGRPIASAEQASTSALAAGETRELLLELAAGPDIVFCGRVVAAEDDSPIPGARIRMRTPLPGEPPVHVSDAAGRFELHSASSLDSQQFTVKSTDRSDRSARAVQGHERPEHAFVVRLARTATLRVQLRDPSGGAIDEAQVSATTSRFGLMEPQDFELELFSADLDGTDPSWTALATLDGRCELSDVAPNVPLDIEVRRDDRVVLQREDAVTLEPGETRELELTIGSGATIEGRVQDSADRAVGGAKLWLVKSEYDEIAYLQRYDKPNASTVADADGRFRFERVAAGKWKLGPAPGDERRATVDESLLAPAPMLVEVAPDATVVDVTMVVHRGLFITGTVLDDEGHRVSQIGVRARAEPASFLHTNSDEDGSFVLGPLAPGEFELQAGELDGEFAAGPIVTVRAGARDVVLRVVPGGTLFGSVVDAAGASHQATLTVQQSGGDGLDRHGYMTSTDGEFRLEGLNAGPHAVIARSGLLVGVAAATAVGGEERGPLRIELKQGASLELVWKGAGASAQYVLRSGNVDVAASWTTKRGPSVDVVPAGALSIDFEDTATRERRTVNVFLAAGEKRVIELGAPE
ncbi:MAG: carboxypeptidase-like regulatory domain-containing protein [Planctomycetes bacterium]|nr:carboxypeptidase-like regulatory domain-containing protein [Planctomycetota bacterium]